jgi:hypothetical protein
MDWNSFRTFHKKKYGTTTAQKLSKDWKAYKQSKKASPKKNIGRGSATTGWGALAPQRGRERQMLKAQCGNKAFLNPSNYGFPVMSLRGGCKVNCKGVQASYNRAKQYGHNDVAKKAKILGEKNCGWSKR